MSFESSSSGLSQEGPQQRHLARKMELAKETINNMKKQHTRWEKIFADNMTSKGLIAKIYKQLM